MEPDSNSVFAALEEDIAAERGVRAWLRSRPTWQRVGLAMLVALAIPGLVLSTWARVDLPLFPRGRLALDLATLVVAALPALWLALRPLYLPRLPSWTTVAVIATAVAAAALIASLPPAHALHPASLRGVGEELIPRAATCFIFGNIFALPIFVALFLLDRRPALDSAALIFAGLVGNIALELHCPMVSPAHLLAGHFTVPLLLALLASLLLWRRH